MKIAYLLRNPGIAARTPEGCSWVLIAPRDDGRYAEADQQELAGADVLVVGLDPLPEDLFAHAKRLRLIQRLGVGYDNIDVEAAVRYGIPVCNMPDQNAATVAEHVIMMILGLLRRVFDSTLLMKAGQWPLSRLAANGIFDLHGKRLGIFGFGAIGRAVAARAKPFDVRTCYFDRRRAPSGVEDALGASFASFDEVLRSADVVTIHVPLTPQTRKLIGKAELEKMKNTALLINTARGAVVDEDALAEALTQGTIAGAGIDVFSVEPADLRHPLRHCPNVLLTPHAASQTREAMDRMVALLQENIRRVAAGETPLHRVDFPPR